MNESLSKIYQNRFKDLEEYRNKVWKILVNSYFDNWLKSRNEILDLGSGYGEFINNTNCSKSHAMDLNPKSIKYLNENIIFHCQDSSEPWKIEKETIDLVFTSNFFEHLPNKELLEKTISNTKNALKPNGILIAMGPNIAILKGKYWDFWDHHVALSEASLCELLELNDFKIIKSYGKFLPYNMVRVKKRPLFLVYLYLRFPIFWKMFGKQFLIIAKKN